MTLRKSCSKDPTQMGMDRSRGYEGPRKGPQSEQIRELCALRQDHSRRGHPATHALLSRHPEHRNQSRNAPKCYTLCPELYFLGQKTECDKLINDPIQGKLQLKHISFPILFFAFTIVFSKSSSNDTHF